MKKFFLFLALCACMLTGLLLCPAALETKEAPLYRDKPVTALYSLDYPARTYQQITGQQDMERVLKALENYQPPVSHKTKDLSECLGFLVFTGEEKYPLYLPHNSSDRQTKELFALSKEMNAAYPRHIQWFVYMSPENIESIQFGGFAGKGYTNKDYQKTYRIDARITERESIEAVSDFLKGMVVTGDTKVFYEPMNPGTPAGLYFLKIYFKNDIVYSCFGPFLDISSSDMKEEIFYSEEESLNQTDSLRDLFLELPETKTEEMTDW
ncbi:MAG: hypothetical protein HFG27_01075 [Provencibacterium sp.]|nr:hypothetical protein [Provencibacterium sp.]